MNTRKSSEDRSYVQSGPVPPPIAANSDNSRKLNPVVAASSSFASAHLALNRVKRKKTSKNIVFVLFVGIICATLGVLVTAIRFNEWLSNERFNSSRKIEELESRLKKTNDLILSLQRRPPLDVQGSQDLQIIELQSRIEQSHLANELLKNQLDELTKTIALQEESKTIESPGVEPKKTGDLTFEKLGITNSRPVIVKAASIPNIAWGASDPYLVIEIGVQVHNTTGKAIAELSFHVQLKSPNRTVPVGETVEKLQIPGGIEPNEKKNLQINVRATALGIDRNKLNLPQLPTDTNLLVAIVDKEDFQSEKKYYEMFANLPYVVAPYSYVDRKDPYFKEFLGQ